MTMSSRCRERCGQSRPASVRQRKPVSCRNSSGSTSWRSSPAFLPASSSSAITSRSSQRCSASRGMVGEQHRRSVDELAHVVAVGGKQQRLAGREVAVERAVPDAGLLGDGAERGVLRCRQRGAGGGRDRGSGGQPPAPARWLPRSGRARCRARRARRAAGSSPRCRPAPRSTPRRGAAPPRPWFTDPRRRELH